MRRALVLLFAFVLSISAQTGGSFTAEFVIRNDPLVSGNMNGTIHYQDGAMQMIRSDFKLPGGDIQEFFNYTGDIRYLKCSVCETSTNNAPFPLYYQAGANGGQAATVNGIAVTVYTLSNNPVNKVYISNTGNFIVKADFVLANGATVAKTIEFTGHRALQSGAFDIISWNCPARKCTQMMDIMLVFDDSGSISDQDFKREVEFGASLADNYNFGADAVQMGYVQYEDEARLVSRLTTVKVNYVNLVKASKHGKGNTCTGCGMQIAWDELRSARGRAKASKIMITLTDGQSNRDYQGRSLTSIATAVKAGGVTCFGIGVGNVKAEEINLISSTNTPGVVTAYPSVPDFASLKKITEQLVVATCVDIPGTPCGAGCKGFCSCGGKCVCPSDCEDRNNCTVEGCSESLNGAGCFFSDTCDPNGRCISEKNPPPGVICNDFNACTTEICDPKIGCVYTNVTCPSKGKCLNNVCNTALGCQERAVDCLLNPIYADKIRTCYTVECADEKGCFLQPIPGTAIDECGVCNGINACKNAPLPDSVPYALTGGALAAVLIFAIVAAAALGAAGGKAGYNVWMNHRNHISGAQTSPLYNDSGLTGASPLYKA